jgi:hypothetical protein
MLVYGDHHERVETEDRAHEINRQLERVRHMPAGLERHSRLAAVLIDGGQLLQGIADALFAKEQRDRQTAATDDLSDVLLQLGQALCRSWDRGFAEIGQLPRLRTSADWPDQVELRVPEGFAFYAVYAEAYIEAARRLKLSGPPRVIGIRSIGTSLGAVVAAALGAPPPETVRPFGDPSARKIAIDPALERELIQGEAHYIIVDEGPGQSGSSFGAVADWLMARGVAAERIAVLPSHAGSPGPAASEERRRWWREVHRQVGDFETCWPQLIARWCSELLGPLDQPPSDISGGAWRRLHYAHEDDWPSVVPAWERRKYLVSAGGERFLVKFAGIGCIGEEKLAQALTLYAEGFVPKPAGLVHGFLVERWCDDAAPLAADDRPLREIAHYIGTRSRLLPTPSGSGASIEELLTMARRNASLELGDELAQAVDAWTSRADALERRIARVRTDNKLDRHEWLRLSSGVLIKTDALDHHQAHDLIGCQDLTWDVAGAIVEFDVGQDDAEAFITAVEEWAVREIDRELLEFYRLAYPVFRLGQARLGQSMIADPRERQRLDHSARRYALELQHLLESSRCATRPESSVGYTPE